MVRGNTILLVLLWLFVGCNSTSRASATASSGQELGEQAALPSEPAEAAPSAEPTLHAVFRRECSGTTLEFAFQEGRIASIDGQDSSGQWSDPFDYTSGCAVMRDAVTSFECDGQNFTHMEVGEQAEDLVWGEDGQLIRRVFSAYGMVIEHTYEYGDEHVTATRHREQGDPEDYRCELQDGRVQRCVTELPAEFGDPTVETFEYSLSGNLVNHRIHVGMTGVTTLMRRFEYDENESHVIAEYSDHGDGTEEERCTWTPPLPLTAELLPRSIRATRPTSMSWFFPFYY